MKDKREFKVLEVEIIGKDQDSNKTIKSKRFIRHSELPVLRKEVKEMGKSWKLRRTGKSKIVKGHSAILKYRE